MAYDAKIILDSISPDGVRLTTMVLTYPRMIHAEVMTYRVFSRNASSSRAIPVERMISQVETDPAMPVWWGKTQKGMAAREELSGAEKAIVQERWLFARDQAVESAGVMLRAGCHRQLVNRILEPWMFITVIVSATDWTNFFAQRIHPDAQPEIRRIAELAREQYLASTPLAVRVGEWHTPFIQPDEVDGLTVEERKRVSVARCARVSYLTPDGVRNVEADLRLFERLRSANPPHASCFEHVATPVEPHSLDRPKVLGCFRGWRQLRHSIPNENVMKLLVE